MQRIAFILTLLLIVAALPAVAEDYKLAPDDVLEMNVWKEPDLSRKQIAITPEGNITVPYINHVIKASGYTQQKLADVIAKEYIDAEILVTPRIEITLVNKHKMTVWVFGYVNRAGEIPFKEGDTVTGAIAAAGYAPDAQPSIAYLTRKSLSGDGSQKIEINLRKLYDEGDKSQDIKLQEGDAIYVPDDTVNRYYVYGSVQRPNTYSLKANATVLSAVSAAGGPTERGSLKSVVLVRGNASDSEKKIIVNLAKVMKGDIKQDVRLEPGDVIYVPETKSPNWGKISQILSAITSIGYIRRNGIF